LARSFDLVERNLILGGAIRNRNTRMAYERAVKQLKNSMKRRQRVHTGAHQRRSWRNLVGKNDRSLAMTLPLSRLSF